MDTQLLRGIRIPNPRFIISELPEKLEKLHNYTKLKSWIPPMNELFNIEENDSVVFDTGETVCSLDISGNDCTITLKNSNNCRRSVQSYMKITHLLDPINYLRDSTDTSILSDKWNQGYVETVATYALGRLRSENISPHFNYYYASYSAIAGTYSYNITDEVESYRMYRWFWDVIESNSATLDVLGDNVETVEELKRVILIKPDYCLETKDETSSVIEELASITSAKEACELESLDSATVSTASIESVSEDSSNESYDDDDECAVYLTVSNFPVMMIFTEKNRDTMDDLLEDYTEVGAVVGTSEWEQRWSAWIFQVIAALCVAQKIFGFIHNDLHTNNIVWSETEEKYLYYTTNNKQCFRVPTYGKIFRIIDFGRAIFHINDHLYVSSDFKEGNDAATQYNFPPLSSDSDSPIVYPNPSFDLARLSVSLLESLYPIKPDAKEDGIVLSFEEGRIVQETKSPLYNLLWSWLIDSEGKNILWDSDDSELFPDFNLYVHIATHCKNSVPYKQISAEAFKMFSVEHIPAKVVPYSLFF